MTSTDIGIATHWNGLLQQVCTELEYLFKEARPHALAHEDDVAHQIREHLVFVGLAVRQILGQEHLDVLFPCSSMPHGAHVCGTSADGAPCGADLR